jgi:Flp pilus assembly protein protease CpaA
LTGLIWGLAIGGLAGLADSIAGCLMLAFPFVLLFIFAGGGAGDAKLLGAIGSWLGLASGAVTLAAVCISGLFLALIFALSAGRLRLTLRNVVTRMRAMLVGLCTGTADLRASRSQAGETQTLPYGLAIATGTILAAVGVFPGHNSRKRPKIKAWLL